MMKSDSGSNWKDHEKNGIPTGCSCGFGAASFTRLGRMRCNRKYSDLTTADLYHQLSSLSRVPLRHQSRRNRRLQDRSVYGTVRQSSYHLGTKPNCAEE